MILVLLVVLLQHLLMQSVNVEVKSGVTRHIVVLLSTVVLHLSQDHCEPTCCFFSRMLTEVRSLP